MSTKIFRSVQGTDALGNPEEFTSDGGLVVEAHKLEHLQDNGLARVGTPVEPGTILIAKFGATGAYAREKLPNDIESLTEGEADLIRKYGGMFYDASVYAPMGLVGRVTRAIISEEHGNMVAVIEVECPD